MNARQQMTVVIGGEEKVVPTGVDLIGDNDLFLVPFSLVKLSNGQADADGYTWINPRRFGASGEKEAQGLSKIELRQLYEDVKEKGLLKSLICRWSLTQGLVVEVLDGERRVLVLEEMLQTNDTVWSLKNKTWQPAQEVYSQVECRIITAASDKEALKIAFMVSDRSVSWGESATAKLVKKLRNCNCCDDEILELTKKSGQWLREMDRICDLDELTFAFLTEGKINRALALRLADIEDIDQRHAVLKSCYEDAVVRFHENRARIEEDVERATTKEELAEAELAEAVHRGNNPGRVSEAEEKVSEAKERIVLKVHQLEEENRPVAKTKNLGRVLSGTEAEDKPLSQPLKISKIRKHREDLEKLYEADGKDKDGEEVCSLEILRYLVGAYKAIENGEENILKVLKRQKQAAILLSKRAEKERAEHDAALHAELN